MIFYWFIDYIGLLGFLNCDYKFSFHSWINIIYRIFEANYCLKMLFGIRFCIINYNLSLSCITFLLSGLENEGSCFLHQIYIILQREDAAQLHQFILHAALDVVQDLAWTTSAM
jgi:hypothetical protein